MPAILSAGLPAVGFEEDDRGLNVAYKAFTNRELLTFAHAASSYVYVIPNSGTETAAT